VENDTIFKRKNPDGMAEMSVNMRVFSGIGSLMPPLQVA
jgi:hypothetical protein